MPQTPNQKPASDHASLKCTVEYHVKNGNTEFVAKNKVVGSMLRHLCNAVGMAWGQFAMPSAGAGTVRLGSGSGATGDGTTGGVTEISTAPSSLSYATDNPVSGTYRYKQIAVWNAGVLANGSVITEIVTKCGTSGICSTLGSGSAVGGSTAMGRLSVSDGEFSQFTIDNSLPTTVEIRFVFTFA